MEFKELKRYLVKAAKNGTLMIPKHDPTNLKTTYKRFRTVLSHDLAPYLETFIRSGLYSVNEFENTRATNSPLYFEIIPNEESGFLITASGIQACSIFGSSVMDRLIAVSGLDEGWHVFGEDSHIIDQKILNGDLINKRSLK